MKMLRYYMIFILVLLMLPILNVKADKFSGKLSYGIDSLVLDKDNISISGWAYFPGVNFCNTDNVNYEKYMMEKTVGSDFEGKTIASKCEGKDYDSVKYFLKLVPIDRNKGTGKTIRLKRTDKSATCNDYWKEGGEGGHLVNCDEDVKYKNCTNIDGNRVCFANQSKEIHYKVRNFRVQNIESGSEFVKNGGAEHDNEYYQTGAYHGVEVKRFFYDDIGFSGNISISDLVPGIEYKVLLYIEYIDNYGTPQNLDYSIAVPEIFASYKINDKDLSYVAIYSSNTAVINQQGTVPFKKEGEGYNNSYANKYGGGYYFAQSYTFSTSSFDRGANNSVRSGNYGLVELCTKKNSIINCCIQLNVH